MKKAVWALGFAAVATLGGFVVRKHQTARDPLHREPSQPTTHAVEPPSEPEQANFSDKRWRQRLDERQAERAISAANGPSGAANGAGVPVHRADGAAQPSNAARDASGAWSGNAAPGSRPPGAAQHDGLNVFNGSQVVNARLSNGPGATGTDATAKDAAAKSETAAKTSAGKSPSSSAGGTTRPVAAPTVRGCGDGVLEAGEECEPASTPKCGDDCTPVITEACYDCEVNSVCVPIASSCVDFTTDKFSQSLCYDVEHCIQDTGCAGGDATLTSCFCGDLSMEQCRSAPSSGDLAPHGACADVIRDAMGPNVSNAFVLTHYTTNATPAGAAIKRFQCLKADPTCAAACFPKLGAK